MKFQLSCFALVCALSLTACSSGSSGSNSSGGDKVIIPSQTQNQTGQPSGSAATNNAATNTNSGNGSSSINKDLTVPTQNPNNQTPSTPSTDSGSTPPNTPTNIILGYTGGGHVQSPIPENGPTIGQTIFDAKITPLEDSYAADKIIIDGREVDLSPRPDKENANVAHIESGLYDTLWLSKGFKHVRFGTHLDIQDMSVHKYGYLTSHFVFGDITPVSEIPHRGSATYSGIAIIRPTWATTSEFEEGTSKFEVDFYNKNITGSVSYELAWGGDPFVTIPLAGKIDGASFSGVHNNGVMYGHFYGPQAAELGGTFAAEVTGNNVHQGIYQTGSFGAKKE